ncbi:unnamed protein product [Linum tenue]|uniref:DYW domain-containing protein n=1 Tax=Linum tenue TaxID=586396 RepID=A0AAV0K8L6_9ROSI|nr:unnamed protein product [Linum tenue]
MGTGRRLWRFSRVHNGWLKPDTFTVSSVLPACGGLLDIDGEVVHGLVEKMGMNAGVIVNNGYLSMDSISWNSMISAYIQNISYGEGMKVFKMMKKELKPASVTCIMILSMFAKAADLDLGKQVHCAVAKLGFDSDLVVENALLDIYAKCWRTDDSLALFRSTRNRNVVSWNTIIVARGQGEDSILAFRMINQMIEKDYDIEPRIEHYACVVDLLSRSGKSSRAELFISSMPVKPDASIWGALLGACRACGETKIAERLSQHIMELELDDPGYYVLASNVVAGFGKRGQVKVIRKSKEAQGLKNELGHSWNDTRNKVFAFGSADKYSEHYQEISNLLEELGSLMSKERYAANVQYACMTLRRMKREDWLCGHCERFAIAFRLLKTDPGIHLQVMKNLRVCRDCHT